MDRDETEDLITEREQTEGPEGHDDDYLAQEIEQALYAGQESSDSSEDEEEEEEEEEEEDHVENDQDKEHIAILKEEISDIEKKIAEKTKQIASQVNPIIKVCFS